MLNQHATVTFLSPAGNNYVMRQKQLHHTGYSYITPSSRAFGQRSKVRGAE